VVKTPAVLKLKLKSLKCEKLTFATNFDVLLTVHLSIFILVINQRNAQNLFFKKFISCLYASTFILISINMMH